MSKADWAKSKENDERQTREKAAFVVARSKIERVCMPMFHGTVEPFEVFDPSKCKSGLGLWLTADRRLAERYARGRDGIVLEFEVDLERVAEYSLAHHNPWLEPPTWRRCFMESGFDGLRVDNDGDTYVIAFVARRVVFVRQHVPPKL